MKSKNAGRITRQDQAWAAAHREYIERGRIAHAEAFADVEAMVCFDHEKALAEVDGVTGLPTLLQDAPRIDVLPAAQSLSVPLKYLSAALLACSKDDIRYYLNGIYVHATQGQINVCGTDGHRLVVSRFELPKGERIPSWVEDGVIIPRGELVEVMPILAKHCKMHSHDCTEPAAILSRVPGAEHVTLRSVIPFAEFTVRPVDGKYPDYARVLASAGQSLVRGEVDPMHATAINREYFKGAADIAAKLEAKAIHAYMGDGETAAVFTFAGAPDTLLIIMPMRMDHGSALPDGVVRLLGSGGVAASISALRAHVTRTQKAIEDTRDTGERAKLEERKAGFEQRIAHLHQLTAEGPKQIEHKAAA